jgi:hypothetical protein
MAADPTVTALTVLLQLRDQTKFGRFLKGNHERTRFAQFLGAQGRFALLANKGALDNVKTEADRPNYGGNSAARTRNNVRLPCIEGRTLPRPVTRQAD